jgi:prepilin-type N-terminal cleavage/methylation domain-containing protein
MKVHSPHAGLKLSPFPARLRNGNAAAFSLIELLVVISIIGVLASLGLVVAGAASRRAKESRVMGELRTIETLIESYRGSVGQVPPDNGSTNPAINQLYYELTGTLYGQENGNGVFSTLSGDQTLSENAVRSIFHAPGFVNSAKSAADIKYKGDVKPSMHQRVSPQYFTPLGVGNVEVDVLALPVDGPATYVPYPVFNTTPVNLTLPQKSNPALKINPWLYDSSSRFRNNKQSGGYDLWAETVIGRKHIRFSNWERKPVVSDR